MRSGIIVAVLAWASPALACSVVGWDAFEAVDDPLDVAPPGPVREVDVEIQRGAGASRDGDLRADDSCGDIGRVTLHVTAPADDRTGPDAMAYRVELADGAPPGDMELPRAPVRTRLGRGFIALTWIDDPSARAPLSLTVRLVPVDAAGHEGPPSAPIVIADAGRAEAAGCSSTGAAPLGWAALSLGLLSRLHRSRPRRRR
jgi:hypothetical protein